MIDATEILSNEIAEKIILSAYNEPITIKEISDRYGIPIAKCYRTARMLESKGLIRATGIFRSVGGKRRKLYQSNMDDAVVYFNNGQLKVRFEVALGMVRDFRRRWERTLAAQQRVK